VSGTPPEPGGEPDAGSAPEPFRLDPDAVSAPEPFRLDPDAVSAPEPFRLDPDAVAIAPPRRRRPVPEPAIDTRRYRWMIGVFGIVLVIAFSIYLFTTRGIQSAGIPAGQRLHNFVAPLSGSNLTGAANANPRCDAAHPNPRALNVCGRTPIVLGLFVTGSHQCERQIDTVQAVSRQFVGRGVQFAALAVDASGATTTSLVRSHHWTIPVAYDPDGRVGELYGVSICPMVEIAGRGGVVSDRLIGNHWISASALAARVRRLLARIG
jgi:hypothetical protein